MSQRIVFSISELNAEVSELLRRGFSVLWVEGELSNFARPASGHMYFSLKDRHAQVKSAMFKNRNMHLRFKPESGMKVLARGRVALYEPRGDYQFIVDHMEEAGEGLLQRQFEALKAKLAAEGLFEHGNKKPLPAYPESIGIITSATGAALQDVLNILKRRAPHIPVWVYPVDVQGDKSAPQIIKAIEQANYEKRCDVLVLTRGGGSLEDLWSFNDESVARTIAAAELPIVSAVGHEIDFTIADFVADMRAPTPSAAAELISPDSDELAIRLSSYQQRLIQGMQRILNTQKERVVWLEGRLRQQSVERKLQQHQQRLDELNIRLTRHIQRKLEQKEQQLDHLSRRLKLQSPVVQLEQRQQSVALLQQRLHRAMQLSVKQSEQRVREVAGRLHAISPLATLERGYSITRKKHQVVQSVKQISEGDEVEVMLKDGELICDVRSLNAKR